MQEMSCLEPKERKMKLFELVLLSQVNSQWVPPMGAGAAGGAAPLLPDGMRLPPRGVSMGAPPPAFPGAPVAMGAPPPMMPGVQMTPDGRFGMASPPQAAFPGAPVAMGAPPQAAFPGAPMAMGVPPPLPPGVQMSATGQVALAPSFPGAPVALAPAPVGTLPPAFPGAPVALAPGFTGAPVAFGAPPPLPDGFSMTSDGRVSFETTIAPPTTTTTATTKLKTEPTQVVTQDYTYEEPTQGEYRQ